MPDAERPAEFAPARTEEQDEATRQWIKSLSPADCEVIIEKALADHDFKGVVAMLHVLAVKDPDRAQAVKDTIELGLEVARRRAERA